MKIQRQNPFSGHIAKAAWCLAMFLGLSWTADGQHRYRSVSKWEYWPEWGGGFNPRLVQLEDYDNDGAKDILLGNWQFRYFDMVSLLGKVAVLSGATGEEIYGYVGNQRTPTTPEESLGLGIASLGDVNGDGVGDFCGACLFGPARVWSGADGSELFRSAYNVEQVAALGDVNGDGLADFGLRRTTSPWGSIDVRAGGTYELLYTARPPFLVYLFGFAIQSLGDVNGDGSPDFAASAPDNPHNIIFEDCNVGHVFVFSGQDGAILYDIPGVGECDFFGYALAAPGDLNGDQVGDVAIGIPGFSVRGLPVGGRVSFHDGKTGALLGEAHSPRPHTFFAKSVEAIGDANGNGFGDVLVFGSIIEDRTHYHSEVWLFDGKTRKPLYVVRRPAPRVEYSSAAFGAAFTRLDDHDGDDFPDFLVGSVGSYSPLRDYLSQLDWFDSAPVGVRSFGEPCSRSRTISPRIGASGIPRIGRDYEIHLSQVDVGQKAMLVIGSSSTRWKGRSLPLDLGFMGLPGCDLLVSMEKTCMAIASRAGGKDGAATVKLSTGTGLAVVGTRVYAQWILLGRGSGVTRALELTIQGTDALEDPGIK